jgi:RimJ/RimL family protein N-acetyltransferase
MSLVFRPTNYQTLDDSRHIARWMSDPSIRHLSQPQFSETAAEPETAEQIQARNREPADYRPVDLILEFEGKPIGHSDILLNPNHRLIREGKVAWLSIVIGEGDFRGKGIGKQTMRFLEERARDLGCDWAEVGLFEFNEPSFRLMKSAGYEEFGRIPEFTYWNGRRWADIRLRKKL